MGKCRHFRGRSFSCLSWTYLFSSCPKEHELAVGFSGWSIACLADSLWHLYTLDVINAERVCKLVESEIGSLWPLWNAVCWRERVRTSAGGWGQWALGRARCVTNRQLWSLYRWRSNWVYFMCCCPWTPPRWGVSTRVVVSWRGFVVGGGWGKDCCGLKGGKAGRTAVRVPAGVVYAVWTSLAVVKPVASIVVVLHGSYQSTRNWGKPSLV